MAACNHEGVGMYVWKLNSQHISYWPKLALLVLKLQGSAMPDLARPLSMLL